MGSLKLVPKEREWSVVITSFLLCAVSLMAADRARKVNLGSAAGFLMQACAGALGIIHSYSEDPPLLLSASLMEVSWVAMVIGLPLVSFGFHWLSDDRLAANSVVSGGILAAACSGTLAEEGRETAIRLAITAPLLSILTVCLFTTNLCGVAGSLAICLVGVVMELQLDELPGLKKVDVQNLLLASGIVALQRALDTLQRALDTQQRADVA
ncbi:transmembrane protein 276-like [Heterodontus francisci]|uniref:transmembrane protein 276-like n=1 Tax=Heterodontus francisci TaxID=7792 RepID=UPI00355C68FC